MMSTRRSATSSSRTVTQLHKGPTATAPSSFSASPPSTRQTPPNNGIASTMAAGQGLTEAGAYARAMTSTLTRSESAQTTTTSPKSSHKLETPQSKSDRPLPRPPGQAIDTAPAVRRTPSSSLQSKAQWTPSQLDVRTAQNPPTFSSSPIKTPSRSQPPVPQSPSKDQSDSLVPRRQARRSDSTGPVTPSGAPSPQSQAQQNQHPQRIGTLNPPTASRRRASVLQRPSGRLQLDFLLAHPAIQSSLLGAIGINTFLSLSGSSENVRRQFTGESVGRWVLKEWTVVAPEQAGNRWPNLTVWEGFRTSTLIQLYVALADEQWNHYCMTQRPTAPIQPGGTTSSDTYRYHILSLSSIYGAYHNHAIQTILCSLSRTMGLVLRIFPSRHLRLV